MKRSGIVKAGTGLAVGALATAPLLGVFALGALAGIPSVPFTVFEWLIRVLPGRFVTFGLDLTVRALEGLGFNVKNTAKTAEQVLALSTLFVAGLVIGLLFFTLVKPGDPGRVRRYGLGVGLVVGAFSAVVASIQGAPASGAGKVGIVIWVVALFLLWGWGIYRLHRVTFPAVAGEPAEMHAVVETREPATEEARLGESAPAEAHAVSRRRFIIQMGGLAATILVAGAGVSQVLRAQVTPEPSQTAKAPVPFPNAGSPIQPVPGTRPEYTAVADHYQIDINLNPLAVDPAEWRLVIDGLVDTPLSLTLDQIKNDYRSVDQFVTLSCISNPIGGDLIGTTYWTGVPFRDILAQAGPQAAARYARIDSQDGFYEAVELSMVNSDPRIMLTYAWNGEPLTQGHGFPLRIYIPDLYGMKQPKWISEITITEESFAGYWVNRGWDRKAEMKTTSVIDTVATDDLVTRDGRIYVPVGGIAHAGAKGISKVEVQVDDGPWEAAQLRAPLSGSTWVIWRYEWPFAEGSHWFAVRAYDGEGRLQETEKTASLPSGATGIHEYQAKILPPER